MIKAGMRERGRRIFAGALAVVSLAGVVLGGLLSGCRKGEKWNLLLITMDTTRADRIRCYGYDRIETPGLNQLAREGVLFERAYSSVPITLPAHLSIMSGLPPRIHGVDDNGAYKVPDEITTMAEIFQKEGWQTAAFISAAVLKKVFNLHQGFDYWDEADLSPQPQGENVLVHERKADRTTEAVLSWLREHGRQPFFLWVHYYDPHAAYDPPAPYDKIYPSKYDGEIAFMDSQILRLLDYLAEAGMYDRTMIVAIADHGESLGEHGEPTHAIFIYEATMHIPFIMKVPGEEALQGKRIKSVVSQVDVLPTVLSYFGLPCPEGVAGENLRPVVEAGEEAEAPRYAFLETSFALLHYGWSPLSGLAGPRYKYIEAPKPELYDLESDPGELRNLLEGGTAELAPEARSALALLKSLRMKKEKEWSARRQESVEAKIGPEEMRQLQALGYVVGGFGGDPEKAKGKDPKDYTHVFSLLHEQRFARGDEDYEEVLTISEKILELDPENLETMRFRADAFFSLGRLEEALAAYEHYFQVHKETVDGLMEVAFIYGRMAQRLPLPPREEQEKYLNKAIEAFQKAMELREGGSHPVIHYYLGRIYLEMGNMEEAYKHLHDESLVDTELGNLGMAVFYEKEGRLALAEVQFKKALDLAEQDNLLPKVEWAQFLLRHGRGGEARQFFEEALEKEPTLKYEPKFMELLERARNSGERGEAAEVLSGATN